MADDMDVPPLEDLSELLQKVLRNKYVKTDNHSSDRIPDMASSDTATSLRCDTSAPIVTDTAKGKEISRHLQTTNKVHYSSSRSAGFGGMKKGFLSGSSSKTLPASKTTNSSTQLTNDEDIPFIKAKKYVTESQHRFDEVQQAMRVSDAFAMNKEWLTEDLLERIQSSGELSRRLQDPMFVQAIAEFQSNPQAAMQKYGDNATMQAFFQEFCALLGEHFSSLGDKQTSTSNSATDGTSKVLVHPPEDAAEISESAGSGAEDARVREILSDSKMREILMDPEVQRLMSYLRSDPDKAQVLLQKADRDLKAKINCLVDAGLLQFQS